MIAPIELARGQASNILSRLQQDPTFRTRLTLDLASVPEASRPECGVLSRTPCQEILSYSDCAQYLTPVGAGGMEGSGPDLEGKETSS